LVTPKVRVCPSLREPISGTTRSRTVHVRTLPNFCAIPWLVPPLAALRYLMYFRFTDDVIFVHNGPFGGVSITLQRATSLRSRTFAALYCMVASSSCTDGGGHPDESIVPRQPGAEPAIYHCLVLLYPSPPARRAKYCDKRVCSVCPQAYFNKKLCPIGLYCVTPYVSQNLVNCCTTSGTSITNPGRK